MYKNGFNLSKNEKVTAVVHELLGQPSYILYAIIHAMRMLSYVLFGQVRQGYVKMVIVVRLGWIRLCRLGSLWLSKVKLGEVLLG